MWFVVLSLCMRVAFKCSLFVYHVLCMVFVCVCVCWVVLCYCVEFSGSVLCVR